MKHVALNLQTYYLYMLMQKIKRNYNLKRYKIDCAYISEIAWSRPIVK